MRMPGTAWLLVVETPTFTVSTLPVGVVYRVCPFTDANANTGLPVGCMVPTAATRLSSAVACGSGEVASPAFSRLTPVFGTVSSRNLSAK